MSQGVKLRVPRKSSLRQCKLSFSKRPRFRQKEKIHFRNSVNMTKDMRGERRTLIRLLFRGERALDASDQPPMAKGEKISLPVQKGEEGGQLRL